ncbi:MAG: dUTP diphosphatase [Clostridia bacterium]
MLVNLGYTCEAQKDLLEHLKTVTGVNYQDATFNVPMWLILALQSELGEVINASQVHKWWSKDKVNREHLLEELSDLLSHIGNLAIFLDVELVLETEEVQVTAIETTFNKLAYRITTLTWDKRRARYTLINYIVPLFLELVYSLGFDLGELEDAYKIKMLGNYSRFK